MTDTKLLKEQCMAKKIKVLFKKRKGLMGSYQDVKDFKEPVVLLMRNNRKIEYFEDQKQQKFIFNHSDGKERAIELSPQFIHTFDYGKRDFRGYVCHEDFPTPLPEIPVVSAEMYQMGIEKTLNDIKKWKAEELKATGQLWRNILMGVAAIIGVLALAKLLVPSLELPFMGGGSKEVAQQVVQQTQVAIENTTVMVRNITKLP